jgi:large subunit ribosomal protein L10
MNKENKTELAKELKDKFSKAQVALFADYKGLTAQQADDLRRKLRATDAEVKVLKNNVARLITKDGKMGEDAKSLMDGVVGPTLVAFAYKDIAATAKVFHKFSTDNEALKVKASLMGAKRISAADVQELASLPSREALLGKLLGTMNAPATSFVGVLAAIPRSFLYVLKAIEAKKAE